MKKGLIFVAVVAMVFVLTGCGKKPSTLTCSMKSGITEVKLNVNFIGKTVNAMSVESDFDYSKYSDATVEATAKQDFCSKIKSVLYQYTLSDCDQSLEDKHVKLKANVDISKVSKSQLVGSPEETKKELEGQGYTCTLK